MSTELERGLARKPTKKAAKKPENRTRRGRKPADGKKAKTQRQRNQKWREGRRQKENEGDVPRAIDGTEIQRCYRDSIGKSRLPMPSIDRCETAAKAISTFMPVLFTRWAEGGFGRARKAAREFLDHIAEPRAGLQSRYQIIQAQGVPDSENPFFCMLEALNRIGEDLGVLLEWDKTTISRARDWRDLAHYIALVAATEWRLAGHRPRSLNVGAPICRFVYNVLKGCGCGREEGTVSAVLYARRGPLPRLDLSNV
jgi:hypothetical protein